MCPVHARFRWSRKSTPIGSDNNCTLATTGIVSQLHLTNIKRAINRILYAIFPFGTLNENRPHFFFGES